MPSITHTHALQLMRKILDFFEGSDVKCVNDVIK